MYSLPNWGCLKICVGIPVFLTLKYIIVCSFHVFTKAFPSFPALLTNIYRVFYFGYPCTNQNHAHVSVQLRKKCFGLFPLLHNFISCIGPLQVTSKLLCYWVSTSKFRHLVQTNCYYPTRKILVFCTTIRTRNCYYFVSLI